MSSPQRPVTLAAIIGAHGVAGEVRLKLFTDTLAALKVHTSFNNGALTLQSARPGSNGTIARFAEITDRTAADAMRGTTLTVPRASLPLLADGEYYHADLVGLACVDTNGVAVGTCIAIDNFGASDVLEIERLLDADGKKGTRFMVPMIPAAVPAWGTECGGVITLDAEFVASL
jgi:16S rRNA processing protein RimM